MIKILIVDDEPLVRIGLKLALEWETHGFTIVGEASNGEQALNLLDQLSPDIVITDIKMPILDGIGLTKEICSKYSNTKVIILSSYSDYEYVREAMKNGAVDYLKKNDINPEKILPILSKLKEEIIRYKLFPNDSDKYKQYVTECISMLRDDFLKELLDENSLNKNEIEEYLRNFNINFPEGHYILLTIFIDNFKEVQKKYSEKDEKLLRFSMKNMADEVLGTASSQFIMCSSSEYVMIFPVEQTDSFIEGLLETCNDFKEVLNDYLNISISIGISNIHTGINGIKIAYGETVKALYFKFYRTKGSTIRYQDIKFIELVQINPGLTQHLFERLQLMIKSKNIKLCNEILEEVRQLIISGNKLLDIKESRSLYLNLVEKFNWIFQEEYFKSNKNSNTYENIVVAENISDIEEVIRNYFIDNIVLISADVDKKDINKILKAVEYINLNYDKELTLQTVADKVNLNAFYFSRVFKKETGISFTDYLTKLRIDKSKELLLEGIKAFEVSEKVGYLNYTYFSKLFKKTVGVNPSKYNIINSGNK